MQTLGCPKNQVDSDKLEGYALARGTSRPTAPRGRPGRGQHLCLHRGGPPGVDRHRAGPGRSPPRGARLVVTGCMAERYGDELAEALPEVDLVAGFGADLARRATIPGTGPPVTPGPVPRRPASGPDREPVRPAEPAPAGRQRPVGLHQGGRGLRPHLRLLRHPVVPGQAALASRPRRSWPRSTLAGARRARLRGGAGGEDRPRSPRTGSYGRDRSPRASGGPPSGGSVPSPHLVPRRCRPGSSAPGCSTSTRPP
jgi:hypothetical protein